MRVESSRAGRTVAVLAASAVVLTLLGPRIGSASPAPASPTFVNPNRIMNGLPAVFEVNQGQLDPQVKFLARGSDYRLYLTPTETVIELQKMVPPAKKTFPTSSIRTLIERPQTEAARLQTSVVRMVLVGANPLAGVQTDEPLKTRINYLHGSDPATWPINVPTFGQVQFKDVYRGINLVYHGNRHRRLEYDFVVGPAGDPRAIALEFRGAERLTIADGGDLVLHTAIGELRQQRPVVYQDINGVRRRVAGEYVIRGANRVGFRVGSYVAGLPLVIDPILDLGPMGVGTANAGATDADGNTVVVGSTPFTTFPAQNGNPGSFLQSSLGNAVCQGLPLGVPCFDAFVAKIRPDNTIIWATYFGGDGSDFANAVAVDSAKNVYVTGDTRSANGFPTKNAIQPALGGGNSCAPASCPADVFVAKFDTNGVLLYSTYFGGTGEDLGTGIAVDASGNAYVSGGTTSDTSFVAGLVNTGTPAVRTFGPRGGPDDVFVAKFSPTGALVYHTVVGGGCEDTANGIAVDASGNANLTGETWFPSLIGACSTSPDFPTTNNAQITAFDTSGTPVAQITAANGNLIDVRVMSFIVKIAVDGSVFYSSYQGTSNTVGLAVTNGSIIVTGQTDSPLFPSVNAIQPSLNGASDAFILRIADPTSPTTPPATLLSTYLGGAGNDTGTGIVANSAGEIYVSGITDDPSGFLTVNAPAPVSTVEPVQVFATKLVITSPTAPPTVVYSAPTGAAPVVDQPTISLSPSGSVVIPGAGDALAIVIPDVKFANLNVKPTINPKSKGDIPVVILSSSNFDATQLDLTSLTFGHAGTEKSFISCDKPADKSKPKDRAKDLTCHFDSQLAKFQYGDTVAKLSGKLKSGVQVTGQGPISTVKAPK